MTLPFSGQTRRHSGFTLIELMIVVAILSILGAIGIPQYQSYVTRSRLAAAMEELASYKAKALLVYNEGSGIPDHDPWWWTEFYGTEQGRSATCERKGVAIPGQGAPNQRELFLACKARGIKASLIPTIFLVSADGGASWKCWLQDGRDIPAKLLPKGCSHEYPFPHS